MRCRGVAWVPHGRGRQCWANGDEYLGGFVRGVKFGRGTFRYGFDGSVFVGHWASGRRHGEGVFIDSETGRLFAAWIDGKPASDGIGATLESHLAKHAQQRNRREWDETTKNSKESSTSAPLQQAPPPCKCITDEIKVALEVAAPIFFVNAFRQCRTCRRLAAPSPYYFRTLLLYLGVVGL